MDELAPMLKKLGYDPYANPPNYGDPDKEIAQNTFHVQANKEYWKDIAKKFSVHVKEV
jgi:protein-tyrosine sulfotransferase